MFYKYEKVVLTEQQQLKKNIIDYFLKNQTGKLTLNVKKVKLRVEYMYGGKYTIRSKEGKEEVYVIELMTTIDKIVKIIMDEKNKGNLAYKLKGLAKLKK